jgi:hypothetical protein
MNNLRLVLSAFLMFSASLAVAEETLGEKTKAVANDVKSGAEKVMNRVTEAVCMDNAAECQAEKVQHRVEEAKGTVKDKVEEAKNVPSPGYVPYQPK